MGITEPSKGNGHHYLNRLVSGFLLAAARSYVPLFARFNPRLILYRELTLKITSGELVFSVRKG